MFVEVVGDGDAGVRRAEGVELGAHCCNLRWQVARVDAHGAEPGAGDLHGERDPLLDVVGVDQQRGARAKRIDLRAERILFGVMQQRERVCSGAHRRHPPATSGFEVARRGKSGDERGAGRGNSTCLTGAARAHLGARAPVGGHDHSRCC